jgi:DsbC/DsbD-like thiol-disulfide interchange protein
MFLGEVRLDLLMRSPRRLSGSLVVFLLVAAGSGAAAPSRHVQAQLVSEVDSIRPGEPFWVGLRLRMAPEWHTYWRNPGDSGLATRLRWTLPGGFQAGPIEWPYPRAFSQGPVTSYGYEGEVLLPVKITPPAPLAPGQVTLATRADWLECQEACIPGRAELSLVLTVRPAAPSPSAAWAQAFAEARRRLPVKPTGWTFDAQETPEKVLLLIRPPRSREPLREAYFFPDQPLVIDHAAPQTLSRAGGAWRLELAPAPNARRPLGGLSGVLVTGGQGGHNEAVRVEARPAGAGGHTTGGGQRPPEQEQKR